MDVTSGRLLCMDDCLMINEFLSSWELFITTTYKIHQNLYRPLTKGAA